MKFTVCTFLAIAATASAFVPTQHASQSRSKIFSPTVMEMAPSEKGSKRKAALKVSYRIAASVIHSTHVVTCHLSHISNSILRRLLVGLLALLEPLLSRQRVHHLLPWLPKRL
jgi:hypothetical protein